MRRSSRFTQWRREWRTASDSRREKQSKAWVGEKLSESAVRPSVCGMLREVRANRVAEMQPETQAATRGGTSTGQPRGQPVAMMRSAA